MVNGSGAKLDMIMVIKLRCEVGVRAKPQNFRFSLTSLLLIYRELSWR
jgi:hypothetical protein